VSRSDQGMEARQDPNLPPFPPRKSWKERSPREALRRDMGVGERTPEMVALNPGAGATQAGVYF